MAEMKFFGLSFYSYCYSTILITVMDTGQAQPLKNKKKD